MDSSIWVATITGLPALRQARSTWRWIVGTFWGGISTPRSPRATITAADHGSGAGDHLFELFDRGSFLKLGDHRDRLACKLTQFVQILWSLNEGQGDLV